MNDRDTESHVVIERSIDAPVELVWAMWTDPAHFAEWYGPTGATITVKAFDVRTGGSRLVCMEMPGPNGSRQMWFAGSFLEVNPPERLSYTEFMSDHEGQPREPFMTTEVRVALHPVDGRTRLVVTHVGIPADSPGAMGWQMALDKLAAYVAETPAGKEPARTP
jgi:uncharacterized protein YndB with AHSA1/START domain